MHSKRDQDNVLGMTTRKIKFWESGSKRQSAKVCMNEYRNSRSQGK